MFLFFRYEDLRSKYGGESPPVEAIQKFVDENFENGDELEVSCLLIVKTLQTPDKCLWWKIVSLWLNVNAVITLKFKFATLDSTAPTACCIIYCVVSRHSMILLHVPAKQ